MASHDYAQPVAEDAEQHGAEDDYADAHEAPADAVPEASATPAGPEKKRTASKRPPKLTDEEKLANALANVASLQEKVTAQRAANRDALIEHLYVTYGVAAIDGDLSEAKRLAALSARITETTSA